MTSGELTSCDPVVFRRCPKDEPYPRRGEPWTPAEDARLLKLAEEALARHPGKTMFMYRKGPAWECASALGRTVSAIQTRYNTLMVCKKRKECSNG